MDGLRQRKPPHKSKKYLDWAKTQHGPCCLCKERSGNELHHLEPGLGKKGSDFLVCRLCKEKCHPWAEGKRRIALTRLGRLDDWADMLEDSVELLSGYAAHLELDKSKK